jgi:hypothetical protein
VYDPLGQNAGTAESDLLAVKSWITTVKGSYPAAKIGEK